MKKQINDNTKRINDLEKELKKIRHIMIYLAGLITGEIGITITGKLMGV